MSFGWEFFQANNLDYEGEYLKQLKKPPTFFVYHPQKQSIRLDSKKEDDEKFNINYIKIPIVNPKSSHLNDAFQMKFYFYLKSYRPEDHWERRNTKIYLE
jgi:hypothetical protein